MSLPKQVLVVFASASSVLVAAAPATARPTAAEAALIDAVNDVRAQHRVAPLRLDATLERAARAHTRTMLRNGAFGHGAFAQRLAAFGIRGTSVGENLAWGVGSSSSAGAIVRMWLNSPPHRANLLRPGFRRIGMGRAVGPFAGYPTAAVVTADFAGP